MGGKPISLSFCRPDDIYQIALYVCVYVHRSVCTYVCELVCASALCLCQPAFVHTWDQPEILDIHLSWMNNVALRVSLFFYQNWQTCSSKHVHHGAAQQFGVAVDPDSK